MINTSTLALVAATAAACLVSPALSQAQERYGSTQPYYYDATGAQVRGTWGPQEQGSNAGSRSQAAAKQARGVKQPRGYNAFGAAPAQRSKGNADR